MTPAPAKRRGSPPSLPPEHYGHPFVPVLLGEAARRGLSDYRLAILAGYDRSMIHFWRKGRIPSLHMLADVARALGYHLTLTPMENLGHD